MRKRALEAIKKLEDAGFEAYMVGGSVRDEFLGETPLDYDLTTSAHPEEIQEVFQEEKTLDVGKKYGTISLVYPEGNLEVTTFRRDGDYQDFRHPDQVDFTESLKEDLNRRDFTINAMAMDREGKIYDYFGGREDLEAGFLQTVGPAQDRIQEDGLRILRAFRMASRFHLDLDLGLREAIEDHRDLLKKISKDRIREEFFKLLLTEDPAYGLYLMEETGVLKVLFPSLFQTVGFDQKNPFHSQALFDHLLCVLNQTPEDLILRLAALFHDIAKPQTLIKTEDGRYHFYGHDKEGAALVGEILQDLRASKDLTKRVQALVENHMSVQREMTDKALRRQIRRLGREDVLRLYDLLWADAFCTGGLRASRMIAERKHRVEALLEEPIFQKKNFLAINGKDLMAIGFQEGRALGETLKACEAYVLDHPERNQKNLLLNYAKKMKN